MKKRRALLGVILPILTLTLSACDFLPTNFFGGKSSSEQSSSRRIRSNNNSSSGNNTSYNNNHVHRFSEEWSYNSQYHWHDSTCGHDVKDSVAPHSFESEIIREATCQQTGQKLNICTICGYEAYVTIPASDHAWSVYDTKEATCTEAGYQKQYCTVCGILSTVTIDPTGHDFAEEIIQEATCTQEGIYKLRCKKCNYSEQYYTGSYGHVWEVIYHQDSTCSAQGYERLQCMRCGATTENYFPLANHLWSSVETMVDTGNGVPYFTDNCVYCGKQKIALATTSGTINNGTIKESVATTNGFLKLSSNGASISIDFDYPSNAYVRIYQHAVYDNWKNEGYRDATYRSTSAVNPTTDGYNFSMSVNGSLVDLSTSSNYTYNDFFGSSDKEIEAFTANGFSPMADCLIGDAELIAGMNNLTYTRLAGYTLNIDYFVLVISDSNHQHLIDSYFYSDEQYHWHQCIEPNCTAENGILDKAEHSFYQDYVRLGASCCDMAEVKYICSVCGYSKIAYEPFDHSFDGSSTTYVTNNDGYQQAINQCSVCGKTVQAYQFSTGTITNGALENNRLKSGTTITWRFPVSKPGPVSLYLPCSVNASSNLTQVFDPSQYSVTFNGNYSDILVQYATYQDLGIKYRDVIYMKFATYEVTEYDVMTSEVVVSFTSNVSSYRLTFDGEVRLEY